MQSHATLWTNGTIAGGAGGHGQVNGAGGVGVILTGGDILTVSQGGKIIGGLSGDGSTRANAVSLSGGGNEVFLNAGANITGNVVSTSGSANGGDQLILGGSGNGSIAANQLQGFGDYLVQNDANWTLTGTGDTAQNWIIDSGSLTGDTTSIQGDVVVSGALRFNQIGSGTYSGIISGSGDVAISGDVAFTGANSYSGGTTIDRGTLTISKDNNLGATVGDVTFNGGTLVTTAGITDSRTFSVNVGGGTINNHGNSDTFSGAFSGSGGMTFFGPGSTILSGANSYSGGTTVDSLSLLILSGNNTGTGATNIDGGTLALTGTGSIADSSGVTNNGSFDISGVTTGGASITTLSGSGTTTLGSNNLTLNNASGTDSGTITGSGGLILA
ncbi:MAG: autotransporter-associated beta strand repeat-containing protein, partial [Acidithiobacillus sp.]|nr:autotransporter-associated beta strand repeat-containing protein [Acidithiobacillus sp.]